MIISTARLDLVELDIEAHRALRGGRLTEVAGASVPADFADGVPSELRIEQLELRAVEEYAVDLETLLADYGPEVLVPPVSLIEGEEPGEPTPYDRAAQEKRAATAVNATDESVYEMSEADAAPRIPNRGMSSRLATMFTASARTLTRESIPGRPIPVT